MTKTATWREGMLRLFFLNESFTLLGNAGGILKSTVDGDVFLSLHTADPGLSPATGQNENEGTVYTGYARKAVARNSTEWLIETGDAPLVTSLLQNAFPQNTGSKVTVTHMGAGCLSTGDGKLCYKMQFSTPVVILAGMTPKWDIREIGFAEV